MINSESESILDLIRANVHSFVDNTRILNTSRSELDFSSFINKHGHFCINGYMFGELYDGKSTCIAKMIEVESLYIKNYYNLVPLMLINETMFWTPEYSELPVCTTEDKYFQELTRTDFKGLEVSDFEEILFFDKIIRGWINECRKNS